MKIRPSTLALLTISILIAVAAVSCGKKKSSSSGTGGDTNNNTNNTSQSVMLSGQLAISSSLAAGEQEAANRGVILFKITQGGEVMSMEELTVNEKGEFSTSLAKENELATKLAACIVNDVVDRACVKNFFPDKAADIDRASDAELNQSIKEMLNGKRREGAFRYVLVSFVKSGIAKDEASSMQFVGMPTAGADDMRVIPADAAKGNINLGQITGAGDEAKATTSANDTFNLSAAALKDIANASQVLKVLKNSWINRVAKPATITPWFGFSSSNLADADNKFSTPDNLSYMGGGYYIGINDIGVTMNDVCPETGDVAAKTVYWNPPAPIVLSGSSSPVSSLSSAKVGNYRRESQYNELSCGHDALYVRAPTYSDKKFMMQIGKNFVGDAPAGYWELKVDSDVKGFWDLAAAKPYDTDPTKPSIFVPAFKVTSENGKATKIEAKFFSYDLQTTKYVEVTDVSGLNSLVHSIGFDIAYSQASGMGDHHIVGQLGNDGIVVAPIEPSKQGVYNCNTAGCIERFGMSYMIGPVSYRMELRPTWQ
jgi:hypothetical protein